MIKRSQLVLGSLFFLLMFTYAGVNTYRVFVQTQQYDGWFANWQDNRAVVIRVDPNGPATTLRPGDEMLAINGQQLAGNSQINALMRVVKPGVPYAVTIKRGAQTEEVRLRTVLRPLSQLSFGLVQRLFIPFVFLVSGFAFFVLKPYDKQAWLLALMFGLFTGLIPNFNTGTTGLPDWLSFMMVATRIVSFSFFTLIFLHFFLLFPDPKGTLSPILRRFPRVERNLYLPLLLLVPLFIFANTSMSDARGVKAAPLRTVFFAVTGGLAFLYVGGGLASLVLNYRQADGAARRKMRVVVLGTILGFTPLLLVIVVGPLGLLGRGGPLQRIIDWVLFVTLPLAPLSFAYAIIRHQVIPVSLIIRRGVRYLLVARGSVVLEGAAVFAALTLFLTMVFNYLQPRSGIVIGVVSGVVSVVVWNAFSWLHARVIAPVIDRRFFREAYDAQAILAELGQAVRAVTGVDELLRLVADKLQQALHTETVAVFLRDEAGGDYQCRLFTRYQEDVHSSVVAQPAFALRPDGSVVKKLRITWQPLEIDFTDPDSWLHRGTQNGEDEAIQQSERETLQQLGSQLLLPLATKNQLLGIVSLGPRLGDLPYSGEDERLLTNVAAQTSFALENARLVERMIIEERRRQEIEAENEQRARELEEARQLQLSMLPKNVPQLPSLDIAAYMKTATEVGGDYYDFYLGEDGTLTVAVGDATGHGLRAGTMVTAFKGLFGAFAHEPEIPKIFSRSSQALKRMNLRALYMAMTMIKVKDNRICVGIAGMPPLLIYRAASGKVEEIAIRGMPLGSFAQLPYQQQELHLAAGDTLMLMSDGFPERFNERGEMLDYAQAKVVLREAAGQQPQEIIEHFVSAGDRWAGTRPQDDDVTFVVLKVKDGNGIPKNVN